MADAATARRDLIVIGSSAGGIPVLMELVQALPADFAADVLIVQHIGAQPSILPELLSAKSQRPAAHPRPNQALNRDASLVAPPDHHMLVVDHRVRLVRTAKENHARPAIDPLFRSAAIAKGARVIGVILSGRLDDGTAGLQAIKACGGLAVVQDPNDCEEPSMPGSAIANAAVDHVVPRAALAPTLMRLAGESVVADQARPSRTLDTENRLTLGEEDSMQRLDSIGAPSQIVCPECNGVLWRLSDSSPPRYRCHTGHAYTLRSLAHTQALRADESLWNALRALHERESLLREMLQISRQRGDEAEIRRLEEEMSHVAGHSQQLEKIATAN